MYLTKNPWHAHLESQVDQSKYDWPSEYRYEQFWNQKLMYDDNPYNYERLNFVMDMSEDCVQHNWECY